MTVKITYPNGKTETFENVFQVSDIVANNVLNDRGILIEKTNFSFHRRDLADITNFTITP